MHNTLECAVSALAQFVVPQNSYAGNITAHPSQIPTVSAVRMKTVELL